ncbi:MAG: alpha/beta hydrolase [Bauldia litoralis]
MPLVRTGDAEIYVEEHGSGPPVIFAAGLGGSGEFFRPQIEALKGSHRVVVFDHRGVGRSGPATPPFSISGLAQDVVRILDALGIERAAFVGHSTGGAMGQWLGATHADRFTRFVLGGTWRRADTRFLEVFKARRAVLTGLGIEAYARHSLHWLYSRDWFEASADRIDGIVAASVQAQPPAEIVAARLDALLASDHAGLMGPVDPPVLVLYAIDDTLLPPAYSEELIAAVPGCRWHRFDGGGHLFPQTRPDAYNEVVGRFLAEA